MKTYSRELFGDLTPQIAYKLMKDGNSRFINNLRMNRNLLQQMNDNADGQLPFAVALSCIDSRTSTELIFDQGLGDIFSIRIAGNIINDDILGSMEYACKVIGSKLIVVLGHTSCGAIKGACDGTSLGHVTGLLEKIKPAIKKTCDSGEIYSNGIFADKVAYANVNHSIDEILDRSDIIASLYHEGKIGIVGGMYSVQNGTVQFIREMFLETATQTILEDQMSM